MLNKFEYVWGNYCTERSHVREGVLSWDQGWGPCAVRSHVGGGLGGEVPV